MEVDSLSSSHPVSTPVENPTQIQEMFDDVSYDKVSLVLSKEPRFVVDRQLELLATGAVQLSEQLVKK